PEAAHEVQCLRREVTRDGADILCGRKQQRYRFFGGAAFDHIEPLDGVVEQTVRADAINGIGRQRDHTTGTQQLDGPGDGLRFGGRQGQCHNYVLTITTRSSPARSLTTATAALGNAARANATTEAPCADPISSMSAPPGARCWGACMSSRRKGSRPSGPPS